MKEVKYNTRLYGNYFVLNDSFAVSSGFHFNTTKSNLLHIDRIEPGNNQAEIVNGFIKVRATSSVTNGNNTQVFHAFGWLPVEEVHEALYAGEQDGLGGDNTGDQAPINKAGLLNVPFSWYWFLLLLPAFVVYKWISK